MTATKEVRYAGRNWEQFQSTIEHYLPRLSRLEHQMLAKKLGLEGEQEMPAAEIAREFRMPPAAVLATVEAAMERIRAFELMERETS